MFFLPQRHVLLEKLDDTLGISEFFFLELIDLLKGSLEGLVSGLDGFLGVLQHLILEH